MRTDTRAEIKRMVGIETAIGIEKGTETETEAGVNASAVAAVAVSVIVDKE